MKRQLTEIEKKMCIRKILDIEKEINWSNYQLEYIQLMLDKGIKINLEQKEAEFRIQKNDYENKLSIAKETLKIVRRQVREGVDIKKEVKELNKNGGKDGR